MHQQGWALQKYNVMYTFKKTEPKDVVYKADFRLEYKDSTEKQKEYIQIYEMCGWKHVTSFGKWNYFCKEVEEENELPDIYSEKETRIQNLLSCYSFCNYVCNNNASFTYVFLDHQNLEFLIYLKA